MFFDSKEISENLACSYCCRRFTDVVKLVPQCGNSICGDCYDALVADLEESREFQCKACDHQPHKMPSEGFPNNITVMKMIKIQPVQKALNSKTKVLKSTIEDIVQKIDMLKLYDETTEINNYCDILETEVTNTVESSIKHLNKLRDEQLSEINRYRNELLDSLTAAPSILQNESDEFKSELGLLSEEIDQFIKEWAEYFCQIKVCWDDTEIEKAQQSAEEFKQTTIILEQKIRNTTFGNKFMLFTENHSFCETNNHLGKLEYKTKLNERENDKLEAEVTRANTTFLYSTIWAPTDRSVWVLQSSPVLRQLDRN